MPNSRKTSLGLLATFLVLAALAVAGASAPSRNPVLELLAPDGMKLSASQLADQDTSAGLSRMIAALEASHRPVPTYLRLVADEYAPKPRQTATFAVGCYWEGERDFGGLDGVLATRTGLVGRDEVVELEFDPAVLDYAQLLGRAQHMGCFRRVYARDANQQQQASTAAAPLIRSARPIDAHTRQHFHLWLHPEYHYLPLTALQATKINAALYARQDPAPFLSPAQEALRDRIAKVLARGRDARDSLDDLEPRRDRPGLGEYCRRLQSRLAALGA